jgi:hypothetical protein
LTARVELLVEEEGEKETKGKEVVLSVEEVAVDKLRSVLFLRSVNRSTVAEVIKDKSVLFPEEFDWLFLMNAINCAGDIRYFFIKLVRDNESSPGSSFLFEFSLSADR